MNSSAPTARAAATISSRVASGRPKAMFSATVPAKRKPSCGTIPSWRRSDSCETSRRSTPSIVIAPAGRVVEAGEQLGDRRLAGAGVADERDRRPGRHVERRSRAAPRARGRRRSGRRRTRRGPRSRSSSTRVRGVEHLGLLVEQVGDLVERGDGREERVVELRELLHRVEEVRQVAEERDERRRSSSAPSNTR